jgi:hypothetical protein
MQQPYFNAFAQQLHEILAALEERRQGQELWEKAEDGLLPKGLSEGMLGHLLHFLLDPNPENQSLGRALLQGLGLAAAQLLEYYLAIQIPLAAYAGQGRPYPETWQETAGLAVFFRRLTDELYIMEWLDPQIVVLQLVRIAAAPGPIKELDHFLDPSHFLAQKSIQLLSRRFFYRSEIAPKCSPKEGVWQAYRNWLHRPLRHLPTWGKSFAEYNLPQILEPEYLAELHDSRFSTKIEASRLLWVLGLWGWDEAQQQQLLWRHNQDKTQFNTPPSQIYLPSFVEKIEENLYSITSIYFDWPGNWRNLAKMPELSQLLVLALRWEQLAKGFRGLDQVKHLHLQGLKLPETEEYFWPFTQLQSLTLSNLTGERLPRALLRLPLWSLSLNQLKGLAADQDWALASGIEELSLERLDWEELPWGLGQLKGLKKLSIKKFPKLNFKKSARVILEIPNLERLILELDSTADLPPKSFWAKHPCLKSVILIQKNGAELYWTV